MVCRCTRSTSRDFPDYGGRGIAVCARWLSFDLFLEDMGTIPPGLSIDRINNDGDYSPDNCRWATRYQQQRNKRSNSVIALDGESLCVAEWAERRGIHPQAIHNRLRAGWSAEDAINGRRAA
jgi:hypothetical protein